MDLTRYGLDKIPGQAFLLVLQCPGATCFPEEEVHSPDACPRWQNRRELAGLTAGRRERGLSTIEIAEEVSP